MRNISKKEIFERYAKKHKLMTTSTCFGNVLQILVTPTTDNTSVYDCVYLKYIYKLGKDVIDKFFVEFECNINEGLKDGYDYETERIPLDVLPKKLEDLVAYRDHKRLEICQANSMKKKQQNLMYFNFASRFGFVGDEKGVDVSGNHWYRSKGKKVKLRIVKNKNKDTNKSLDVYFDIIGYSSFVLRKTNLESENLNEMILYHLKLANAYEK